MHRHVFVLAAAAAMMLATTDYALCVTNGALDGDAHPAIGLLLATNPGDICAGNHQFISDCSVTLIDADLALTTADCAAAFSGGLASGLVDQVWVILDENPVAPSGSPYDCTKFIDVDEAEIVSNPAWEIDPFTGANLGVVRLVSPSGISPVQLPTEDRLQTVPRAPDVLTAVTIGGTTLPAGGGYDIFDARRRFSPAKIDPPLEENFVQVELAAGGSPDQACFGFASDGGAVFVRDTNEAVALTVATFSPTCPASGKMTRLDVQSARDFLDDYVTVP